jgi:tetratricopeptide (TPR) repeat protein
MRLAALLLLMALPAAAAPPDPATVRAKELFTHAEALYALTKYDQALAEYEKAYETKPLPGFLFNIGQCHKNLGNYDKALHFYRAYLERDPGARNRALVESLIAETTEQARAHPAEPPAPQPEKQPDKPIVDLHPPAQPPVDEVPLQRRWYVWAGVAGLVVILAVALGVGFGIASSTPHGKLTTIDARQ